MLTTFKQIPRGIWITFFAIMGNSFGWAITAYMALFLHLHRDFSVTQVGAVMAGFGIGALAGAYLSGRLTDKYPAHQICTVSLVVNCLTLLTIPFLHNDILMMVMTMIMGTANSAFSPANRVYIMKACPLAIRTQVTNIRYTMMNIGVGSGVFLCTLLSQWGVILPFYASSLMLIVAAIFLAYEGDFRAMPAAAENITTPTGAGDNKLLYFWLVIVFSFLLQCIFSQIRSTLPLYLYRYYHLNQQLFGHLFLLNCVLIVLLQIPLSSLLARINNYRVAAIGSICIGIGFALFAFDHQYWWALLATTIWTIGEMIYFPMSQILTYDLSPHDKKGWGMGMYQFSYALGNIIGPAAGSFALAHHYPHITWLLAGVFGLAIAIGLHIMHKATLAAPAPALVLD